MDDIVLKTKILETLDEYYCELNTGGSGGTGATGPISRNYAAKYYLHKQENPDSIWRVCHNFNQQYVQVQVIDFNNQVITPQEIQFINKNIVHIYFGVEVVGFVTVLAGPNLSETVYENQYDLLYTGGTGNTGGTGHTGGTGPRGYSGLQGPAGPQGAPGNDGIRGRDGRDGPPGPPGPQGPPGPAGPQGIPGKDGSAVYTGGTGARGCPGPIGRYNWQAGTYSFNPQAINLCQDDVFNLENDLSIAFQEAMVVLVHYIVYDEFDRLYHYQTDILTRETNTTPFEIQTYKTPYKMYGWAIPLC